MQKTETIEMQKLRLQKYSKDRIPFMNTEYTASEDKTVFEQYRNKQISKESAMRRIARNNFLPYVTEEQFDNEFKFLGYEPYLESDSE